MLRSIYRGCEALASYLQSPFLLIIRLIWGGMFIQTGFGKLMNLQNTSSFFASLDIPYPTLNAFLVGSVETLGGVLLVLGLFTRIATIPLIITMIGAYFLAHYKAIAALTTNPKLFLDQAPFMFLYTCLVLLAFGPGLFSIDAWLKRK
ncbi:MAG: DoxX family protein [Chlamydiales bacterium]